MIFSGKDFREVFAEVYDFGVKNAKPLNMAAINDMFGVLLELQTQLNEDRENGRVFLKLWLMKAVVPYLIHCFKQEGG